MSAKGRALATAASMKPALEETGRLYSRLAGASDLKYAREKAFLLDLLKRTPALRECTVESLAQALLQAGSAGLSLNPVARHVYIVPRKARKQRDGESDAEYAAVPTYAYASPSYIGLIDLAVRSGRVSWMVAETVFSGDQFRYMGPAAAPHHGGVIIAKERSEERAVGVYCIAGLPGGDRLTTYMDREQVQRIRRMSEMPEGLMWHPAKLWTEGWRKAVIRRAWKTLPRSPAMLAAEEVLNQHEGIVLQPDAPMAPAQVVEPPRLSLEQLEQLSGLLSAAGIGDAEAAKWMQRLARRFSVDSVEKVPAAAMPAATQLLEMAIADRKERKP